MKNFWIALLAYPLMVCGQDDLMKKTAYFEMGGSGGWYSLNYDRFMKETGDGIIVGRAGLEFADRSLFLIPTCLYLKPFKDGNKFIEGGLGLGIKTKFGSGVYPYLIPSIGYRIQPTTEKRLLIRVTATPLILWKFWELPSRNLWHLVFPWAGVSVGYGF